MRKITLRDIGDKYQKLAEPNLDKNKRVSIGLDSMVGEFFFIKIDDLLPYPKQARKNFNEEDISNLASTIREYGIRQPLTIKKTLETGKYWVISGERRLKAAKLVGLEKVPCIILDDTLSAEEVSLIENTQRADLHPVELSNAYNSLLKNYNHGDQKKLKIKLGVPKSHISETLKYANLPENIKNQLIEKNIRNRSLLRRLCKCSNDVDMEEILNEKIKISKKKERRLLSFSIGIDNNDIKLRCVNFEILTGLQKENLKNKLLKILSEL